MIVGDPANRICIHRKMKVGCSHLLRVILPSSFCQFVRISAARGGGMKLEAAFSGNCREPSEEAGDESTHSFAKNANEWAPSKRTYSLVMVAMLPSSLVS